MQNLSPLIMKTSNEITKVRGTNERFPINLNQKYVVVFS